MPATPAWPPKSLPRLFVDDALCEGARVQLDECQANYLGNVLRLRQGAQLLVFDGRSGEWLARIDEAVKKSMALIVETQTREHETIPDAWLAFAPVKRAGTDWLVEKATELGASRLIPIVTRRTVVDRVRVDRLRSIAIEAAEQCGRTTLPEIDDPATLQEFLGRLGGKRALYFADEEGGEPAAAAIEPGSAAILVGPEGGFTDEERAVIRSSPAVTTISLGPRILRAETAALAALTVFMATAGDWRA